MLRAKLDYVINNAKDPEQVLSEIDILIEQGCQFQVEDRKEIQELVVKIVDWMEKMEAMVDSGPKKGWPSDSGKTDKKEVKDVVKKGSTGDLVKKLLELLGFDLDLFVRLSRFRKIIVGYCVEKNKSVDGCMEQWPLESLFQCARSEIFSENLERVYSIVTERIEYQKIASPKLNYLQELILNEMHRQDQSDENLELLFWLLNLTMPFQLPFLSNLENKLLKYFNVVSIMLKRTQVHQPLKRFVQTLYILFPNKFLEFSRMYNAQHLTIISDILITLPFNKRLLNDPKQETTREFWQKADILSLLHEVNSNLISRKYQSPSKLLEQSNESVSSSTIMQGSLSSPDELQLSQNRKLWWQKIFQVQNTIDYYFGGNEGPSDNNNLERKYLTLKNELLYERALRQQQSILLNDSKKAIISSRAQKYSKISKDGLHEIYVRQFNTEISQLKEECKRWKEKCNSTRNNFSEWNEKIKKKSEDDNEKIERLRQQNLSLTERNDHLETQIEKLKNARLSKEAIISGLETKVTSNIALDDQLRESKQQILSLQQEVQIWETNYTKFVNTFKNYRELRTELVFRDKYIASLSHTIEKGQNTIKKLMSALQIENNLVKRMKIEGEKFRKENENMKKLLNLEKSNSEVKRQALENKYINCKKILDALYESIASSSVKYTKATQYNKKHIE